MSLKKEFGNRGEEVAKAYLEARNHTYKASHIYTYGGEIDLLMYDNSTHELVFVEVKTRSGKYYNGLEVVYNKQKNTLEKAIYNILEEYNQTDLWRLDIILCTLTYDGFWLIEWYKNIE